MTEVLYVVGARPNFMKAAPVYHELRERLPSARQVIVHTGQHYDPVMSSVFFDELGLPNPDHWLGIGSGRHGAQTGRALEQLEVVLEREQPRLVIVVGDVNSTLAGALAAVKLGIPIAHVEAGLRSFDRTMPEEINRVLVDQIATWCFIHSPEAEENLLREGVPRNAIFYVGNTMIDSLVRLRPRIRASDALRRLGLSPRGYVLVTLHRPKLVDGPLLQDALESLAALSRELTVVFPVHPRTRARVRRAPNATDLHLIDPVGYVDCLALQAGSAAVITDSGGVQEETTFLRVPCFTLRETTERPITITRGTNRLLGLEIKRIEELPWLLTDTVLPLTPPPGWDGQAAARIADVLLPAIEGDAERLPERTRVPA